MCSAGLMLRVWAERRFALWLGFAAALVGIVASVARWPWPAELAAFVVFAVVLIPTWRRYGGKA